jgi:hypothetical protein
LGPLPSIELSLNLAGDDTEWVVGEELLGGLAAFHFWKETFHPVARYRLSIGIVSCKNIKK